MAGRKNIMPSKVQRAHQLVNYAIKRGDLDKPDACELCGKTDKVVTRQNINGDIHNITVEANIVAHHHKGYSDNHIYDVWFICKMCNSRLRGCHDGVLTKDQARELVVKYWSTGQVAKELKTHSYVIIKKIREGKFPGAIRLSDIIGESTKRRNWWLIPVEDVRQYVKANSIEQGDTMTKKSKRGGRRTPPGGRPKGAGAKPESEKAKRFTIRLYAHELEALNSLVKLGYGDDKTDVIRKAIMEILANLQAKN